MDAESPKKILGLLGSTIICDPFVPLPLHAVFAPSPSFDGLERAAGD